MHTDNSKRTMVPGGLYLLSHRPWQSDWHRIVTLWSVAKLFLLMYFSLGKWSYFARRMPSFWDTCRQTSAFVLEKEPILTISSQHACHCSLAPQSSHWYWAELWSKFQRKVPSICFQMIVFDTYLGPIWGIFKVTHIIFYYQGLRVCRCILEPCITFHSTKLVTLRVNKGLHFIRLL
jgi:hypothetical protein